MSKVSIITPWLDLPELIPAYMEAVKFADEVIIVDTGSTDDTKQTLAEALNDLSDGDSKCLGWLYSYPERRTGNYGHWCNYGVKESTGDIVCILNNDVAGNPQWVNLMKQDVDASSVCGPSLRAQPFRGVPIPFLEGWCMAMTRQAWEAVGGFDTDTFTGNYWEDNDLCLRLSLAGYTLKHCPHWPIRHLNNGEGNTTGKLHPEAYAGAEANRVAFYKRLEETVGAMS